MTDLGTPPAGLDPLDGADPFGLVPPAVAVLEPFVRAGVLGPAEVHLADTLVRLSRRDARRPGAPSGGSGGGQVDGLVVLAAAIAARAPRSGHVCVELDDVGRIVVDRGDADTELLRWPEPGPWAEALGRSPLVADAENATLAPLRPLVWDRDRLYLQRLWSDEVQVADDLWARADHAVDLDPAAAEALAAVFGTDAVQDRQHLAGRRALEGRLAVVVGGPGTGKTRTVARLLAAALVAEPDLQLALCAPTGKAAARMTDAVQSAVRQLGDEGAVDPSVLDALGQVEASTVHRLLGRRRGGGVRHDRRSPLPHDLVVVDETSMVDLPLMARLLDALRPETRLVLVGDPNQLASVEAGTVLADLVESPAGTASVLAPRVVELTVAHRFGAGSGIAALAEAVRRGDADTAIELLGSGATDVHWVRPGSGAELDRLRDEVIDAAVQMATAAREGRVADALGAARRLKVLAATRRGPLGLYDWSEQIEAGVAAVLPELRTGRRWEVGRPFMVTRNDPVARVANGDTGVVADLHGRRVLAIDTGAATPLPVPVARLDQVDTWWAMTIHKSQGSEFDHAVVSLPDEDSPVLTRELLYTAVTRAREQVTVVADEGTVRRAIGRPVSRASGLRDRLVR
jgi:exodeoxyribonuclease V alpha subunit